MRPRMTSRLNLLLIHPGHLLIQHAILDPHGALGTSECGSDTATSFPCLPTIVMLLPTDYLADPLTVIVDLMERAFPSRSCRMPISTG